MFRTLDCGENDDHDDGDYDCDNHDNHGNGEYVTWGGGMVS